MYVCVHISMYVCMYTCMYVCIYLSLYTYRENLAPGACPLTSHTTLVLLLPSGAPWTKSHPLDAQAIRHCQLMAWPQSALRLHLLFTPSPPRS